MGLAVGPAVGWHEVHMTRRVRPAVALRQCVANVPRPLARLTRVITAIVLINAEVNRIPEVAQEIAELQGVSEVYSVAGDADLIAMVRVRAHEELADVIADRLNKVAGVLGTSTHIAFRTYSQHDLESAFSLGLDE